MVRTKSSDRWIPRQRNLSITCPTFLDVGKTWERVVEALHQHLLSYQHVIDLPASLLRSASKSNIGRQPGLRTKSAGRSVTSACTNTLSEPEAITCET